jgi:hypothetical protein
VSTTTFVVNLLLPEAVQRCVGNVWDDAFARYVPQHFRFSSLQDWTREIARFVNHMLTKAMGTPPLPERLALSRGVSVLSHGRRLSQGQMLSMYRAARDGVDEKQTIHLQRMEIFQGLKEEGVESYITDILLRHCPADDPAVQEQVVRDLFNEVEPLLGRLGGDTDFRNPAYYASQADSMIRQYARHLSKMARSF